MSQHEGHRVPPIFDELGVGITLHDPETGAILDVNERLEELYGYSAAELRRMEVGEYTAEDSRFSQEQAVAAIRKAAAGEPQSFDWHVRQASGDLVWVSVRLSTAEIDGDEIVIAEIDDITERKERERRLDAIFNGTFQFTGLLDTDGTLLKANDTALEFGGFDRESVVGEKMWDAPWFTHDEQVRQEAREAVERAREGEFVRSEVPVQGADGIVTIDFSLRPLRDERGNVTLLIPEGRDISQLKRREEELELTNDLLSRTEAMSDVGGWELDVASGTISSTAGARAIFDVSSDELELDNVLSYFKEQDRESVRAAIDDCIESGEPFRLERQITSDDERERWIGIHGERVATEPSTVLRGVVQDVTDRKEREQRLMVSNRVLRHNLRNDLSAILAFTDELDRTLDVLGASDAGDETVTDDPLPDAAVDDDPLDHAQSYLDKIAASTDSLRSMADRFHEFERTSGSDDPEEHLAVSTVARQVVDEVRESHPDADISTDFADATVRARRSELRVPLEELLTNAVEHSDRECPTVGLTVSTVAGGRVEIQVADDGPGIPEMEQSVLERGEETPLMHGSGLGLWLVNWYATRLDGRVLIDDNHPRGSIVRLALPAAES